MPPDSTAIDQEGVLSAGLRIVAGGDASSPGWSPPGWARGPIRRVIAALEDGRFRYSLDNGAAIAVEVRVDRRARSARIDFSGTSPRRPNNFNAPAAVTKAAVVAGNVGLMETPGGGGYGPAG